MHGYGGMLSSSCRWHALYCCVGLHQQAHRHNRSFFCAAEGAWQCVSRLLYVLHLLLFVLSPLCESGVIVTCHLYLQMFHVGPNYLEVDLDVHSYAFLARKALWSYHDKIATAVWELGFVIQVCTAGTYLLLFGCVQPSEPASRSGISYGSSLNVLSCLNAAANGTIMEILLHSAHSCAHH